MKKYHHCIICFLILFYLDFRVYAILEEELLFVNNEDDVFKERNLSYAAKQHGNSRTEMVTLYGKMMETLHRKTRSLGMRQTNLDLTGYDLNNNTLKFPTADDRNQTKIALDNLNLTSDILYRTLQMEHLYCPMSPTCLLNSRLHYSDMSPYRSCCDSCSCAKDCHLFSSCCADADVIDTRSNVATECILPQYLPYGKSEVNHQSALISVVKCKSEYTEIKERDLCERPETMLGSLDTSLPVISNGTVYRNRFCALCNGESETHIQSFSGQLVCPDAQGVYAYTISNLLDKLLYEKRCNILYYFPHNISDPSVIYNSKCNIGYVQECNVTGKWREYDPEIEKACKSYTHLYQGIYRNIFCFMCNNEIDPFMKCSSTDIDISGGFRMGTFTAMLRFSDPVDEVKYTEESPGCNGNEIMDNYQNTCLLVKCTNPFSYDKNEKTCSKVFLDAKNAYELVLHVTMDTKSRSVSLLPYIEDYLRHGNSVWEILWHQVYEVSNVNNSSPTNAIYHLIYYDFDSIGRIQYVLDVVNYIKSTFGMVIDVGILTEQFYDDFDNLSSYYFPYDERPLQQKVNVYTLRPSKFQYTFSIQRVSSLLICPLIALQNYTTFISETRYELCVREINVCFQRPNFLNINDTYIVCVEEFVKLMEKLSTPRNPRLNLLYRYDDVEGIISLVCTCISVACLVYVVATFLLFKSLRTFPGKLILVLALSLIIAHLLYQFGFFQTENPTVCTVLGIFIHFSWLWVIFWMNISCFHMVNVFTRTMPLPTHTNSRFLGYNIYVFVCSVSFVGINIIVSHLQGDGIGYGDNFCWISRREMVKYVFALPLGLVVLCNFLMFLGVVISLQRRPNLQQIKDRNRQDFVIFVKLTSITGISWVFGFLYEWLHIKVFSYLFIVLTGSQGLYLMIAFSCNSRVKHLYKAAFQGSPTNSNSKSNSSLSYQITKTSRNSA